MDVKIIIKRTVITKGLVFIDSKKNGSLKETRYALIINATPAISIGNLDITPFISSNSLK